MTVLVLDSPELIARAAALEAAQATEEVQAEETRAVLADAEVSPPGRPARTPAKERITDSREDALALVM